MLTLVDDINDTVSASPHPRRFLNGAIRAQCAHNIRWADCDANGERLAARIRQLLGDTVRPQYEANAQRYRDVVFGTRLRTPLATAMHGIELVLRFGTVNHLWPIDGELYWPQKSGLDVCIVLFSFLSGFLLIFIKHCSLWPNSGRRGNPNEENMNVTTDQRMKIE